MPSLSDLFGGGGGSSQGGVKSPVTTTTTETRAATGQSYADRNSQAISGFNLQDSASVQLTDLGAINKAFEFTERSLQAALASTAQTQAATANAFESAQGLSGAINADDLTKWGLAAGVLVVIAFAYFGSR